MSEKGCVIVDIQGIIELSDRQKETLLKTVFSSIYQIKNLYLPDFIIIVDAISFVFGWILGASNQ